MPIVLKKGEPVTDSEELSLNYLNNDLPMPHIHMQITDNSSSKA